MLKASKVSVMITVFIFFAICTSLAILVCVYCNKKNQPRHHVFLLFCYSYRCEQQKMLKAIPLDFLVLYFLFFSWVMNQPHLLLELSGFVVLKLMLR